MNSQYLNFYFIGVFGIKQDEFLLSNEQNLEIANIIKKQLDCPQKEVKSNWIILDLSDKLEKFLETECSKKIRFAADIHIAELGFYHSRVSFRISIEPFDHSNNKDLKQIRELRYDITRFVEKMTNKIRNCNGEIKKIFNNDENVGAYLSLFPIISNNNNSNLVNIFSDKFTGWSIQTNDPKTNKEVSLRPSIASIMINTKKDYAVSEELINDLADILYPMLYRRKKENENNNVDFNQEEHIRLASYLSNYANSTHTKKTLKEDLGRSRTNTILMGIAAFAGIEILGNWFVSITSYNNLVLLNLVKFLAAIVVIIICYVRYKKSKSERGCDCELPNI